MKNQNHNRVYMICAMCIFGTIGLLRKYIDLPSSIIALARAVIGTAFLGLLLCLKKQKLNFDSIRKNALMLLLSGACLGFNWILLFEAYCYTTVATATLCYYTAPILVILVSSLLFREGFSLKKGICVAAALVGIVLVSGILENTSGGPADSKGIAFGLSAALLYATVVLLNKGIRDIHALERTILQLGIAALILLPYTLLTENWSAMELNTTGTILLLIAGILHTGIAYALYFGSVRSLPTQTVALYSYIDPILAIILSAVFLSEPMTLSGGIGAVLILGAAIISERNT